MCFQSDHVFWSHTANGHGTHVFQVSAKYHRQTSRTRALQPFAFGNILCTFSPKVNFDVKTLTLTTDTRSETTQKQKLHLNSFDIHQSSCVFASPCTECVCARHFFGETDRRREFKDVEPMELIADFDLGSSLSGGGAFGTSSMTLNNFELDLNFWPYRKFKMTF